MKLRDYIDNLEREIAQVREDRERVEQSERLKAVLAKYQGKDRLITSAEVVERVRNRPHTTTYATGFPKLDDILGGGFREQQLVVLSAPTKAGKTTYCMALSANLSALNVLWLPFEQSADELAEQILERGGEVPHFVTPEHMAGRKVDWIEKRVVEGVVKFNTKLVVVDHLHFMLERSENMSTQIGFVVRELKTIARRWNVVIVLIAHLKTTELDHQPTINDLRDSSFIAQDADTVVFLWRETRRNDRGEIEITSNTNLSVQANRRTGRTGNVKLVYRDGKFYEEEWRYEPSEADLALEALGSL